MENNVRILVLEDEERNLRLMETLSLMASRARGLAKNLFHPKRLSR
jgi:hypothetical protein